MSEIVLLLVFNPPPPPDKIAFAIAGFTCVSACAGLSSAISGYEANLKAETAVAMSTTEDAGSDPKVIEKQVKINRYSAPTKEGAKLGSAYKTLNEGMPPLKFGSKEIDSIRAFEHITTGLLPEKAKLATYIMGVECKPKVGGSDDISISKAENLVYEAPKGGAFYSELKKQDQVNLHKELENVGDVKFKPDDNCGSKQNVLKESKPSYFQKFKYKKK